MKPTTLLIAAGLLSGLCTLPATASPMLALDAAQTLSQISINPIFMHYEGVDGSVAAIEEAAATIDQAVAEAERSADPPDPNDTRAIQKVGAGQLILAGMLRDAADQNTSTDSTGRKVIDCEGFAATLARMLNNKNPELTRFAALGWETTEKRATAKLAALLKKPTLEGTNGAIIAILIGMVQEVEGNTYYVGSANGGVWKTTNGAVDASDLNVWRDNFGRAGG